MLTMGRPLKMGGNAWKYLTESVAGAAELGADAADYYAAKGTPPGRFLGRGLDGLGPGPGSVKPGDVVSPEMLHRMLAQLADPVTGQPLGRLPSTGQRAPVAGYDLTFHPPNSVSLMWAMGDQVTRTAIEDVMAEALSEVVSWAEDHVFFTRTGAQGARQEAVRGVVASTWLLLVPVLRRVALTSARDALNGYQKGACFYCYSPVSTVSKVVGVADVDHLFPRRLQQLGIVPNWTRCGTSCLPARAVTVGPWASSTSRPTSATWPGWSAVTNTSLLVITR
jgi:hypothetical protein